MTSPFVTPMPPWTPEDLRARHHALDVHRGKFYSKAEVDALLVSVLGALQGAHESVEKADLARDNALDALREYTSEHPDHITVPLQAQAMLMRAQTECDEFIAATRDYCETLLGDAEVYATSVRTETIGDLVEPVPTSNEAADAEALADWLDDAEAYLARRRAEAKAALDASIERFHAARQRLGTPNVPALDAATF